MKKSASHKTRVGFFVVLGTLILVAALYFIGNRQHIFSKNMQVFAVFQNVNGLQLGNNVRYSGINVGTVAAIEMVDEATIVVQMMVEEKTGAFIKKDAIATIGSDGLVGSMVVNILPGNENRFAITSGDTIPTYSKIGADDMLSTLNVTNENAALLTADLLKITNKILEGEGTLGALIADTTLTQNIHTSLENLKNTTQSANTLINSLHEKLSKINMEKSAAGVLLNDTVTGNKMQRMVSNLEKSSRTVSETMGQLEAMVAEINTKKSTFNYLTQDEALPKTIDSTMQQIKEASQKLNENMEALKHNFLFRGYFRKLERQAKRQEKAANQ